MIQAMQESRSAASPDTSFLARLSERSRQPIASCYQCQRCSSWCPVAEHMDLRPHQMVRLLQLGLEDRLYQSRGIWLCVGCAGCGANCPNDIDFHRVADALQQLADTSARANAAALTAFDKAFLATVRTRGRASEVGLVMRFKLATGKFMADMRLGMWMFFVGKLKLLGGRINGRREVAEIFRRSQRGEGKR